MRLSPEDLEELWPWMRGLRTIVQTIADPPLFGGTVLSACDIGGLHNDSKYKVYGFVFLDAFGSPGWPALTRDIRRRFLHNDRRMSFKALNDKQRRDALLPFLQATELMTGVCVVVAVSKNFRYMASTPNTVAAMRGVGALTGNWNEGALEAALRLILMWSLITREVCIANQHLTLVLDDDEIVANDLRHDDVLQLAGRFSSLVLNRPMGELCVCRVSDEGAGIASEDFVAIADLAVGAFSEMLNKFDQPISEAESGRFTASGFSGKSELVTDWFFARTPGLRRVAAVLEKHPTGRTSICRINCQPDEAV